MSVRVSLVDRSPDDRLQRMRVVFVGPFRDEVPVGQIYALMGMIKSAVDDIGLKITTTPVPSLHIPVTWVDLWVDIPKEEAQDAAVAIRVVLNGSIGEHVASLVNEPARV